MESLAAGTSDRHMPHAAFKRLCLLTVVGCLTFWAITNVFARLSVAAEYRRALSIHYVDGVLIGPLFGGVVVAGLVSFFLLRFFEALPTKNPILKSLTVSVSALGIAAVIVLLSVRGLGDGAFRTILIGTMLNIPRFLALGLVVGYLHARLYGSDVVKERG
jgi:hypothetical protein